MQALIDFLGAYEPLYPQVVKGYPDERIAELERVLGRPVPSAYRDFLQTAAANLGFVVDQVTFDIDEVIELAEWKRDAMPPYLYPIAVEDVQPGSDYYLDTSRPAWDGDGMVVGFAAGSLAFDVLEPEYPSLRDMLFLKGFRHVRLPKLPHRESVSWRFEDFADPGTAPRRSEVDSALDHMGIRRLGVTSNAVALHDRGDCVAIVFESKTGGGFHILLAASDPAGVAVVAESLCHSTHGHATRRTL